MWRRFAAATVCYCLLLSVTVCYRVWPRLRGLPPTSRVVLEDHWLGAALWSLVGTRPHTRCTHFTHTVPHAFPRCADLLILCAHRVWLQVGSSAPLAVFSLAGGWGSLYMDTDGFRVHRSLIYFHNRWKMVNRLRVLYEFSRSNVSQGRHCRLQVRWVRDRRFAHAGRGRGARASTLWHPPLPIGAARGAGKGAGGGAPPPPQHSWSLWAVWVNRSSCGNRSLVDLRSPDTLRAFGVLPRLSGVNLREKA